MIVSPEIPTTKTVVKLTPGKAGILASFFESDDTFRKIVKHAGYSWDGNSKRWYRKIDVYAGTVQDRLIEDASILIAAGFIVEINDTLGQRLQAGDWMPEHKRWVIAVSNSFGLRWRGDNESLYRKSLTFPETHWIQAEDRSHRIGQTMPVTYIDIVSDSGIDSRIQAALSKKQDVVKAFRKEIKSVKELGEL